MKLMENGLHGLAEKLPSEGLTRPGSFLFDFLAEFNIRESTLATINSTIDIATQARGTGDSGGDEEKVKGWGPGMLHVPVHHPMPPIMPSWGCRCSRPMTWMKVTPARPPNRTTSREFMTGGG